jgi:serine/threonine-protein kinase RsbW
MVRSRQFDARRQNLPVIRDFVEQNAALLGADLDVIFKIAAAVDEAATNIIVHAYGDRGGPLLIELERDGDAVRVHLRDSAPAFDPRTIPVPDLTLPLEERPLGGMGFYLIRQYVDKIEYAVPPNGGNELTLVKSLAADDLTG